MAKWIMMTCTEKSISIQRRFNMPVMLRPNGKAKKIAYAILGKPANMNKRTPKERELDRRLLYEESYRVR